MLYLDCCMHNLVRFTFSDILRQCLPICTLIHTLSVLDIIPISIQIAYYTIVRKSCRYYNMFKSISFAMYHVKSILLLSYVVWPNDLSHEIFIDRFVLLESLATPAMDIKLRTEFFLIL